MERGSFAGGWKEVRSQMNAAERVPSGGRGTVFPEEGCRGEGSDLVKGRVLFSRGHTVDLQLP